MQLTESLKKGFVKGLETTWLLVKITLPVYIIVSLLRATPVLDWTASLFQPIMGLFGLPGEASIVLVLGNVLNLFAAIGAIKAMSLTAGQITTLALMLSFAHSLPVETAVAQKLGLKILPVIGLRLGLAAISGLVCGHIVG